MVHWVPRRGQCWMVYSQCNNYDNEAILADLKAQKQTYVMPAVNISINNPLAVVDANIDRNGTRVVAEAFVQFLRVYPSTP